MTKEQQEAVQKALAAIGAAERAITDARAALSAILGDAASSGAARPPKMRLAGGVVVTSGRSLPQCGVSERHMQLRAASELKRVGWSKRRHMVRGERVNRWYAPGHGPL